MGKFNFDEIIDRRGTDALKTDALTERYGDADLIPMWVADMDFKSSPAIIDAIIKRAQHGIFGYTKAPQSYYNAIVNWLNSYHHWSIKQEWITFVPGVVKGIAFCIDSFLSAGDKIAIQSPVYPPFRHVPQMHQYEVLNNNLKLENSRFEIDFDNLAEILSDEKCKLFILCNPHNPGGRVWTSDELKKIADLCYENNVLVLSDEIHADLYFNGHHHTPFASVSDKAAMNSITLMAPSKTFNIAGIISSFSVIPNPAILKKFNDFLNLSELSAGHIFAYTAAEAAYNHGREWLEEAKEYIWENIMFTDKYLKENIPQIKAMIPEASFLIWLDCRELQLTQKDLVDMFVKDAKLALNDGISFGQGGEGFMRLNVGCPRSILEKALENLKKAVSQKQND